MKIERVRVEAFGRLRDWDSGPEVLPGLVVVLGPNEAGKSTLFHCLTSLLYGFRPASRESNPYAPWGGLDMAAEAVVRLDDGSCVDVQRRLLSQPTGRMTLDGRTEDLRNRALPWTEHVPMQVFRQVFALTLADLAELDDETWGRVQDRIVGAMGASDVASAREVAAELEREAGELWRPNRRGNQRIREVQERIRELRGQRRDALARDTELRGFVAERDRTRERLQEAREERQRERLAVERVRELLPVRRQLRRIEALREQADPAVELDGLPAQPGRRLEELSRQVGELAARRANLEDEAREPERVVSAYGPAEAELVSRAEAITAFAARAAGAAVERATARGLEREVEDLERRLETEAGRILSASWRDVSVERWQAVPLREVRGAVQSFLAADEELRILREAERLGPAAAPPAGRLALPAGGTGAALVGATLLALGLYGGNTLAAVGGSLLAIVGLLLLVASLKLRRPGGRGDGGGRARAAGEAKGRARDALAQLLHDVPVSPGLLEAPTDFLPTGLEAIRELLRERVERIRTLDGLGERLRALDAEARDLLPAPSPGQAPDAETAAHRLERELARAERAREAASAAEREIGRAGRERERVEREAAGVAADMEDLRRRLIELGQGDLDRGTRTAVERIQALRRADELADELQRAHPSLDDMTARIAEAERRGESWTMDDDDLVRRSARIEELSEEIESLATRAESLDGTIMRMRELETVDAVDGETATLQEEEARLTLERDRRWVLAALLRDADRRFRDEHQPDLIRRAGGYLAHLTGGRYDRIVADETAHGDLFHVYGPALPGPVPLAPPVSTGTLEQAYLSLRFAIVDHLDQGGERLPLFVDEIFVNWDEARRTRGMEVLADIASTRQLFVFTCHDEVAASLSARGARVLDLAAR
jgi:uncharacterized protein YhaN